MHLHRRGRKGKRDEFHWFWLSRVVIHGSRGDVIVRRLDNVYTPKVVMDMSKSNNCKCLHTGVECVSVYSANRQNREEQ